MMFIGRIYQSHTVIPYVYSLCTPSPFEICAIFYILYSLDEEVKDPVAIELSQALFRDNIRSIFGPKYVDSESRSHHPSPSGGMSGATSK